MRRDLSKEPQIDRTMKGMRSMAKLFQVDPVWNHDRVSRTQGRERSEDLRRRGNPAVDAPVENVSSNRIKKVSGEDDLCRQPPGCGRNHCVVSGNVSVDDI